MIPTAGLFAALTLFGNVLGATTDPTDPTRDPVGYSGAEGELQIEVPLAEGASIRIDGVLDDPAWDDAALLHSFTQYDPVEGIPATQRTEALVLLTADALIVGVRAFEDDPSGVRASLSERDNVVRRDDYVRVTLDTFDDQRRAYVFIANPIGVQQDGIWSEGGGGGGRGRFGPPVDYNPDFIWESEGRVEEWGYSIEMSIPLKSLRFPDLDRQNWGINVMRRIERSGYEESWAPISKDQVNELAQSGRLMRLTGLDAGLFLELNPVVTSIRAGDVNDAGSFTHGGIDSDFGMNATYGVTSNLTLDATYNPDFSQVEADAGQIQVNERFALFFPEKRPFFLEGTEIFNMPKQLVYTRSVIDPIGGAKLTGKVGDLGVGYLGAIDEASVSGEDAIVNLLRVRRDLGASSSVGAVYTDRTESSDVFNRVAGADARLVLGQRHTLTLIGALSRTSEEGLDGTTGGLWGARFERTGRIFSYHAELEDVSSDFRAGSGFIRRLGETQVNARAGYNWYGGRGSLLERWGPNLEFRGFWEHDEFWSAGGLQESELQVQATFSFRGNVSIFNTYSRSSFSYPGSAYEGLFERAADGAVTPFRPASSEFAGMDGLRVFVFFNNWQRFRGRVSSAWSETPIFDRSRGVPVEVADEWNADINVSVFPTASFLVELGLRHSTLDRALDGSRFSTATIPRLRAQYQLSKSLFVRAITEYGRQERGDLRSGSAAILVECEEDGTCEPVTGSPAYDFSIEALLSYEPSPGTVLFFGYSRQMEDVGPFEFRELSPESDGLFAKLSYRFRF